MKSAECRNGAIPYREARRLCKRYGLGSVMIIGVGYGGKVEQVEHTRGGLRSIAERVTVADRGLAANEWR